VADLLNQLSTALADRYRLERELGRGGMATVFLAHDLRHDRSVALKVLHPELAQTLGPERFQREIKLAARLQHPHILGVYDSGEAAGQLWFTMPYVDGESLRDRLAREGQLPVEDAVRITREAAAALDYAHRHDTVHRDIKPENILLTSDGDALVADFGIARALRDGGDALTQTGLTVGTPAYMSPEQASGGPVDARTDVYSLGTVLYEMLAGEPPFTGPSAQAITTRRFSEPVRPLRGVRESVPEALELAVLMALARAPADRFATAAQFAQALALPGYPSNLPTTPSAPSARTGRRHWPIGITALALGFMLGLGVLFAWRRNHAAAPPPAPLRLAVLPFENLGDSADAYFADGVTEEIRGKLAAIPDLQVIASSSSNQYRGTAKRPEQIGRELSVGYLLWGRVRWSKNASGAPRVRVDPELMQLETGGVPITRWQQPFDAPLTDVFQVQADIATRVAQELQLTLTPSTKRVLTERPTQNLAAYDAYLRGLEYEQNGEDASEELARAAFKEAIDRDSTFALAWTGLARTYIPSHGLLPEPADAESWRQAIDRALALAPDLPEAHAREGEYQTFVRHDNRKALAAYETGLHRAPNNALLLDRIGWAEMRLGRWDSAVVHFTQATRLDPRSGTRVSDLSVVYWALRRYPEARAAAERASVLMPGGLYVMSRRVGIALSEGDLAAAQRLFHTVPPTLDLATLLADQEVWALDGDQLRILASAPSSAFGRQSAPRSLTLTRVYLRIGDSVRAHRFANSARVAYQQALARTPDDPVLHAYLGTALAYLGRRDRAVDEGLRATSMLPIGQDALWG
jgi:serine/threonine-protein kinase